ncbi:MAG: homoserine dehydrogenase, partial [SAR202 cluster bacterium]|nr:homoserine dehydrogenase [SAR202 cluster bacterium]
MENSLPPHLLCQADWDAGREGGAEPLGIGLLGMGVVGSGLARVMTERGDWLAQRAGRPLALRRVLVRDTYKRRDVHLPHRVVTDRPEEVLADPDIHIVVEALGGTKPARELVLTAIEMGKHVVTANKALMAWHGREILEAAWQRGAQVRFEATVGGALWRGLAADRVTCVRGIVNGTTNYILSRMAKEGVAIEDALREAQRLGYAEPDPTSDVDGTDAACKLVILCRLAFGAEIRVEEVSREGILHLAPEDFAGAE